MIKKIEKGKKIIFWEEDNLGMYQEEDYIRLKFVMYGYVRTRNKKLNSIQFIDIKKIIVNISLLLFEIITN